jgi:hypothetical protein
MAGFRVILWLSLDNCVLLVQFFCSSQYITQKSPARPRIFLAPAIFSTAHDLRMLAYRFVKQQAGEY